MQIQRLRARAEQGQPESQFLLSQICLQDKDLEGMVHWLRRASAKELPDALESLGHCYEKGLGMPRDFIAALAHYDRAVEGGSSVASYRKGELLYKSQRGPASKNLICDLLLTAAEADFVPALRAIGYLAMQHASSRDLGLDCLRRAAQAGDPVSSFNLGWCLVQGWGGAGAELEAAQCLQRAARAQYPFSETLLASIQGVQLAAPLQRREQKTESGASFSLFPESRSVDHQVLCADPAVTLYKEVLNIPDCAYLIFLSRPYMKRANVIDPGSQRDGMVSDVRTNMSTYLPFGIVDIISRYIELKIIQATGEDLMSSEPMSILHYAPGQYYRPHFDYIDPELGVSEGLLEDGGQRTASAITYLAAPSMGGGTRFPRLNLSVPATAGSTLWFRNCLDDGRLDDRSLHGGDPVEQGEKWVVTKWFREGQTRYLEF